MKSKEEQITGIIKKIVYTGENNFAILNIKPQNGKLFTALGNIEYPIKNAGVVLIGEWVENKSRHEMQFKFRQAFCSGIDTKDAAAIKFLSGTIKGIGDNTAREIVEEFGNNIDEIMETPKQLLKIKGISNSKLPGIISSYALTRPLFGIYAVTGGEITPNQAEKIYKKFGDKSQEILKNNPYMITYVVDGFGFKRADALAKKCGYKYDSRERLSAGITYCLKTAATETGHCFLYADELKESALDLLFPITEMVTVMYQDVLKTTIPNDLVYWNTSNLGILIHDHPKIVKNMLSKWHDSEEREKYYTKHELSSEEIDTIDIYLAKLEMMEDAFNSLLDEFSYDMSDFATDKALEFLYRTENSAKYLVKCKDNCNVETFYERENYILEQQVTQLLSHMLTKPVSIDIPDSVITTEIQSYENETGNVLGEEQIEAVRNTLTNRISIITGGPGRGKTTIESIIIRIWELCGGNIISLAPTGRASQRMAESTGHNAFTIHRKMYEQTLGDQKTLILADEMSMANLNLVKKLLSKAGDCHIVFIGDADQLPCIGIGDFFADIIKSGIVPCVKLITCYRNSGSIAENCDIINAGGKLRELKKDNMTKICLSSDAMSVQSNILSFYGKMLETYKKADIGIIVPQRQRGTTCTTVLNKMIQDKFNPPAPNKKEMMIKGVIFREGDRILHTKNNYDIVCSKNNREIMGVFNGETGEIISINPEAETMRIMFDDGKVASYEKASLYQIDLAYAITVHKAQGSEYPCLIMGFVNGDYNLLSRKIFYTGASRAKKILGIFGMPAAIQRAISNANFTERHTLLWYRLKEYKKQQEEEVF